MDVLSPAGSTDASVEPLTRRPRSLRGLRVGLLDNSKPNADALLGRVGELLVERCGAASVRTWRKPGSSRAATNLDEIAAAADVVLTASAD